MRRNACWTLTQMNSNEVEQAASQWLARLDAGSLSASDLAELNTWRAADPRHAAAYARLAATWQALDRMQALRPPPSEPIVDDFLNLRASHRIPSLDQLAPLAGLDPDRTMQAALPRPGPLPGRSWLWRIAVAASISLVIAAASIWRLGDNSQTYRTGIGGFERIVLADQSAIDLNTNSEVRVRLMRRVRKVDLIRGEASFSVTHDVERPFIVAAGLTGVRAIGTHFDVRQMDNSVEVIVDEGKVVVGDLALVDVRGTMASIPGLHLAAGESAIATGQGVELNTIPKERLVRKLAWQTQMLVFDDDSLAEVVAQFNRYNIRQLILTDPKLANLTIGGYFRPTNLDAFLSVLQSDFGVRVSIEGNSVLLATSKED
jgi:transmembrane sensor